MIKIERTGLRGKYLEYTLGFLNQSKLNQTFEEYKNHNELEKLIQYLTENEELILEPEDEKNLDFIERESYLYESEKGEQFTVKNHSFHIFLYEKISKSKARKEAIKNLTNIIEDEKLTIADKKIIRDVALETLKINLNLIKNKYPEDILLTRVDLHPYAYNKLRTYGFKINPFYCNKK